MKHGFIKVATISPKLEVGNPLFNIKEILKTLDNNKSSISLFPELCITGYSCGDLFFQAMLLSEAYEALDYFLKNNTYKGISILGMPINHEGSLYNCAVIINAKEILGVIPKTHMANSGEYSEKRYFKSSYSKNTKECFILGKYYPFGHIIFHDRVNNLHFSAEICEDMWNYITPGNILSSKGVNLMFNLSASNEYLNKEEIRKNVVLDNSRRNNGAYIYVSSGACESTSDSVNSSHSIVGVNGKLLNESTNLTLDSKIMYTDIDVASINYHRHKNTNFHDEVVNIDVIDIDFALNHDIRFVFENEFDITPFVPKENLEKAYEKITDILKFSLAKRLNHINCKKVILGLSGGLDSAMALLTCVETFKILNLDTKDIICVTMPTNQSTKKTKDNAINLAKQLEVTLRKIPIQEAVLNQFNLIGHDVNVQDITFENTQARIRTLILMNLANKEKAIVVGTGDMSEMALGFCTYGGDQFSMYNINSGLPKTLIRFLVKKHANSKFVNVKDILLDIIKTPISPELVEGQVTEDIIGSYEVNDFILYRYLTSGDSLEKITYLIKHVFDLDNKKASWYVDNFFKRFFMNQYKRNASPDGVKVLDVSLNAKSDYKLPSDIKRWD